MAKPVVGAIAIMHSQGGIGNPFYCGAQTG